MRATAAGQVDDNATYRDLAKSSSRLSAVQATPPPAPSKRPGKIIMSGKDKISSNPPLPRIAAIVRGSCQMASMAAAPAILVTDARPAVTTPAMAPLTNESDRHAAQKPAASRVPTPRAVDTVLRV